MKSCTNTIALIGGNYKRDVIKKCEQLHNVKILFHDGLSGRKKEIETVIRAADTVVVVTSFCSHNSLYAVKETVQKLQCKASYPKATNLNLVVQQGIQHLKAS